MSDIVERLKSQNELYVQKYVGTYDIDENKIEPLCTEAAAEITSLRAQVEKLRAALKAAYFEGWYRGNNLRSPVHNAERDWEESAAAAALKETGDE